MVIHSWNLTWLCRLKEIFLHPILCLYLILHFVFVYFITIIRLQSNTVHQFFPPSIYHKILYILNVKENVKINWMNRPNRGMGINTTPTYIYTYVNTSRSTHYILWYLCSDTSSDGMGFIQVIFHSVARPLYHSSFCC